MTDPETKAQERPATPQPPADEDRRASRSALLVPAAVLVGILAIATIALALTASSKAPLPGGARGTRAPSYAGEELTPLKPAPPIELDNYLGRPVSLASYRGRAVFVTFLYTHCPDVCPLIASQLHVAQAELGARAAHVQIVAVSVDPRRDDRASVAEFLRVHQMTGRMQYLIGSSSQLGRVWQAWNVGSERDAGNPELVAHTALVYGISARGYVTTIYPANFKPSDIVHDVPALLTH
jgi:protein SCO1